MLLIRHCGDDSISFFRSARFACASFSLIGAGVCYFWAKSLYGNAAGLMAMVLWCACPNVLAHGQMITPDVGAGAVGAAATFAYWTWLKQPGWSRAFIVGMALGLAALTKFTCLILFFLWPLIWLVWHFLRDHHSSRLLLSQSFQLLLMFIVAIWIVNVAYAFEGSFQQLGDFEFLSETFGSQPRENNGQTTGNRFGDSWLGGVRVPFPRCFVLGIDYIKWEYEQTKPSYLRGEWKHGGWWYYYLYAMAVKIPLGTWVLFILAAVFARRYAAKWRDEVVLLAPAVAVIALVSSQTGFNHHLRYVLPAFPFLFIWASKVAKSVELKHWAVASIAGAALAWSIVSSLWVYPHSLSYFNELAGGPRNGHWHLVDSNIDWGQDVLFFKDWRDEHQEIETVYVDFFCYYDLKAIGIDCPKTPPAPEPGWYAISVHRLHDRHGRHDWLLFHHEPDEMIGYSIYIYHIDEREAAEARARGGWERREGPT